MSTTIHDSLDLKKKELLDKRLAPVPTYSALPVLNSNTVFMPEGAVILVQDSNKNYQAQIDPLNIPNLIWVDISGSDALVVGNISLATTSTVLDMSLVTPPIAKCHSVIVQILSGFNVVSINNILNLPIGKNISLFTTAGNTVTFKHTDYDAPGSDAIVLEDGFDFILTGRTIGIESLTVQKQGRKVCQVSATQFIKSSEIQQLIIGALTVVDNLSSTDGTLALSANQGRILDNKIFNKQDKFNLGTKLSFSGLGPFTLNANSFPVRRVGVSEATLSSNISAEATAPIDMLNYRVYFNSTEGSFILSPNTVSNSANWVQIASVPTSTVSETIITLPTAGIPFLNGYTAVPGVDPPRIRKNNFYQVSACGLITIPVATGSSITLGAPIFNLPIGYRPYSAGVSPVLTQVPVVATYNNNVIQNAYISIDPTSGAVSLVAKLTTTTVTEIYISLDSINFYTT